MGKQVSELKCGDIKTVTYWFFLMSLLDATLFYFMVFESPCFNADSIQGLLYYDIVIPVPPENV